jgi:predicted component of type VI protein secretion system
MRPRYGEMSQSQRALSDASHHNYVKRLNDAWRNPGPKPAASPAPAPAPQAPIVKAGHEAAADTAQRLGMNPPTVGTRTAEQQAQADAAYAKRNARLEDAWRHPRTKVPT